MMMQKRGNEKTLSDVFRKLSERIQLKYMWILLVIFVVIYSVYNSLFYNPTVFQISSTMLTIYVISLTMYTSNKELHKASSKQAESFNQSIGSLTKSANDFKNVLKNYADYFKAFLEKQEKDQILKETEIDIKYRPVIYFTPSWYKWGWGDYKQRLRLKIENEGGYAMDIVILAGVTENRVNAGNLGRNMYTDKVDCGDPRNVGGLAIQLKVYLGDMLQRKYFTDFNIDFSKGERVQVPLILIS